MLLGAVDPLEGSLLIVPGSGMVALGTALAKLPRLTVRYWTCTFGLIALGVVAMFILSAFGGIGGKHGKPAWWGITITPYPVGLILALAGGIVAVMRAIKRRAHSGKMADQQPTS